MGRSPGAHLIISPCVEVAKVHHPSRGSHGGIQSLHARQLQNRSIGTVVWWFTFYRAGGAFSQCVACTVPHAKPAGPRRLVERMPIRRPSHARLTGVSAAGGSRPVLQTRWKQSWKDTPGLRLRTCGRAWFTRGGRWDANTLSRWLSNRNNENVLTRRSVTSRIYPLARRQHSNGS